MPWTTTLDLTEFAGTLTRLERERHFSGAVEITVGGERVFAGAYGLASRAWRAPCTLDTPFDTASIHRG